ncbi:glycoside hydrolase family 25 protein [Saccharopolyspora sp. 6V]|uniref:glycoside hydrolase family 25 protein n=1 Tax=Saccharopolyspora sp. 6V TaxID=2877239 RepID=UPI001CD4A673|nr:glycoside hydrolase family 25 protein [Saccharopolyspora sp. 6V]MCA1191604.1 glycoside hydrolase family 25 protein [Saccharopolyspora sp. 6V]
MIWGIDISHHQGVFDLSRTRAEGFDFAFLKATEGSSFVDKRFSANLANARSAGLLVAAYHYQRSTASAAAQVAHIQRVVPRDVPVILDVEDGSGNAALTRDLNARLNAAGYRTPLLYLPRWYWQQIGSPSLAGLPPLWFSRYPDNRGGTASGIYGRVPASYWNGYGGLDVAVLQFTSSATVAGHTPVDANAYRGTREQLAALLGGAPAAPASPGGIESMAFDDTFTTRYNKSLSVRDYMAWTDYRLNELYNAVLGRRQSKIPGDKNLTTGADLWFDSGSWDNQTLGHVVAIRAALAQQQGLDPAAVADALRPALVDLVGPVVRDAVTTALGDDNQAQADAIVDQIAERLGQGAAA